MAAQLKQLRDKWDLGHPVNEIELQLSGLRFSDGPETNVQLADKIPPMQKRLVETVMTLPGTTVEEFRRCNAVDPYCHFHEGGAVAMSRGRPPTQAKGACPQLVAADAEKQALRAAMLLVLKEKTPTTCFVCLGEKSLPFEKRIYSLQVRET